MFRRSLSQATEVEPGPRNFKRSVKEIGFFLLWNVAGSCTDEELTEPFGGLFQVSVIFSLSFLYPVLLPLKYDIYRETKDIVSPR